MEHNCSKVEEIKALEDKGELLQSQIHDMQIRGVKQDKETEKIYYILGKVDKTLNELRTTMEDLGSRPLMKYEKIWNTVAGGIIGAVIAFVMGVILK